MPETTYSTTTHLGVERIWDFVQDMDNWAPFLTGYQSHRKQSEQLSEWTLKGDVGVLARSVTFKVCVTEWSGPERVSFRLEGVNEDMGGEGSFELSRDPGAGAAEAGAERRGWLARLWAAIARFFYRRLHGRTERIAREGGSSGTRVTFRLSIEPGGPMAPMVSAMIEPALAPAAEDLLNKILNRLEGP